MIHMRRSIKSLKSGASKGGPETPSRVISTSTNLTVDTRATNSTWDGIRVETIEGGNSISTK